MISKLAHTIVGILFYESDSLKIADIALLTGKSVEHVKEALDEIAEMYNVADSSVTLLMHNDNYQFVVAGDAREMILLRDAKEREGELSKAALETLASIMYLGEATKNQIDYIRGVQSSYMLRVLLGRGLIARGAKSGRDSVYIPTIETLRFMGISHITDMPEYEKIHADLSAAAKSSTVISE